VERIIVELLGEIVSLDVPFKPTGDLQKHCPDCLFKVTCGTQWVRS